MTIKCIIFDLGDVIINLDFNQFFNEVITPSPLDKPKTPVMMEFFRQSDTYHQGIISDKEFYQQACDLLRICSLDKKAFFKAFNSIISDLNKDMVNLIKKIKKKNDFRFICISNINASHWSYLKKQKWNIWEIFDDFILSHEVHLTKPNPEIFQLAIDKANCQPNEILFIDDGLNNVRAANALGINTIRFVEIEDLVENLKKFNVSL